jgi:hypothetical protein
MKGFIRPEVKVLPEGAVVPDRNVIKPAPNQFTHELTRPQPFYFDEARQSGPADGELGEGTPVVLLFHDGGAYCRVADGRGLYVEVEYDALRTIPAGR